MTNENTAAVGTADSTTNDKHNNCPDCGSQLKSGMKYQDICLSCQPLFKQRCSGCQRILWDCQCIKPHTWE